MNLRLGSGEAAGVCQIRAEGEIRDVFEPRDLRNIEEVLGPRLITRDLRPLIAERRPTGELREKALEAGFLDMRRGALLKVARGQTSAEEVLRAIPPEELGLDE